MVLPEPGIVPHHARYGVSPQGEKYDENDKEAEEHDSQHMSPNESSSLFCEGSVTDTLPHKIPRTTLVTFERKKQAGDAAVLPNGFDVLSQV